MWPRLILCCKQRIWRTRFTNCIFKYTQTYGCGVTKKPSRNKQKVVYQPETVNHLPSPPTRLPNSVFKDKSKKIIPNQLVCDTEFNAGLKGPLKQARLHKPRRKSGVRASFPIPLFTTPGDRKARLPEPPDKRLPLGPEHGTPIVPFRIRPTGRFPRSPGTCSRSCGKPALASWLQSGSGPRGSREGSKGYYRL